MAVRPRHALAPAVLGNRRNRLYCNWLVLGPTGIGARPSIDEWLYWPGPDLNAVTPTPFDDAQTGVTATGSQFGASQGTGEVELGDSADHATATLVAQTVTAWADGSITFTADLGALAPGTLWLFVTTNGGLTSEGRPVQVRRAAAFTDSASPNITAAGADATTARLTAPSGKSTSDFDAGRRVDDSATTPSTTTTGLDYTEHEFALEATAAAVAAETYEFRLVRSDGTVLDTYTVTPEWTISGGGGTTFPVNMAGAMASAGALARQDGKALTAATASAGTLTRQPRKALAGTGTSAGALTRRAGKQVAGTVASSGALATVKAVLRTFTGAMASAGSLARQTNKPLAGSTSSSGLLTRRPGKALAGSATSAGVLTTARVALLAVAGAMASSGALVRRAGKLLAGTTVTSGTLTRQPRKALAGTLTTSGAVATTRVVVLALAGAMASAGTLAKRAGITATGTQASSGALTRQARKVLAGVVSAVGSLSATGGSTPSGWGWLLRRGGANHPAAAKLNGLHPTTADVT